MGRARGVKYAVSMAHGFFVARRSVATISPFSRAIQTCECFRLAIEIGDEQDRREWAMTMLLVARALERIGDNAVDIGEQVAFVVTGLFQEFEDASHPSGAVG